MQVNEREKIKSIKSLKNDLPNRITKTEIQSREMEGEGMQTINTSIKNHTWTKLEVILELKIKWTYKYTISSIELTN